MSLSEQEREEWRELAAAVRAGSLAAAVYAGFRKPRPWHIPREPETLAEVLFDVMPREDVNRLMALLQSKLVAAKNG